MCVCALRYINWPNGIFGFCFSKLFPIENPMRIVYEYFRA